MLPISRPAPMLRPSRLCTALLAAGLASATALPALAQSGDTAPLAATRPFDIPAQPLADALRSYMRQSGVQVAYPAALANGASSTAVYGALDAQAALAQLLQGSGLAPRALGPGAVTLERAPRGQGEDGVIHTAPLRVAGDQASAEGTAERALEQYRSSGSSVYVPRTTLERFRGTSTADIVKGVVGVTAGDPRTANALDLNIRGIQGQSRIPVIIDGGQSTMDTYRGYAGQSQRTYLDPDLISSLTVTKGPSLGANASGGIGGVVEMETLNIGDVLRDGQDAGLRVRSGISNGSARDLPAYNGTPGTDRSSLGGQFFNIAGGKHWESFDLVAAYAWRDTGNYYSGKHGYDDFPQTRRTLAPLNPPNTEVFNTSSKSNSVLLKGTWRIDDVQTLEAGYRHYSGRQGEIMASQIIRVDRDRVPQWEPGSVDLDAYNLRYRFNPGNDIVDLKANLWYTQADSLMYNGLTGITPWYFDRRTEWYDGPTFNTDPGYKDAYRNDMSQTRFGLDVSNTMVMTTDSAGLFTFDYGLSFSDEDVGPGDSAPIMHDDLVNNRFLRNATRREYSAVASMKWQPGERWDILVGGRFNRVSIHDRNRLATPETEEVIGQYRYTQLLNGNPALPAWRAQRIAMLNWYPDANGQFTEASLLASPYKKGTVADITGWNFHDVTATEDLVVPTSWTWSQPIRRTDNAFMPTASVTWHADEDTLVYLKYAEGVKLPSLFESTLGLFTAAKPVGGELKPERAGTWEVGASTVRHDLFAEGDQAAFKLAYFNTRIDDLITRDYRTLSAGYIRNIDRFKVSGLEFQSSYDAGKVFADLSAHYYFEAKTCAPDIAAERRAYGVQRKNEELAKTPDCVDGGFEGSYSNTQNPPRYTVNLTLGSRLLDQRLSFGTRVIHNSGPISKLDKEWNVGLSAIQQLYQPATIVDVFASWQASEQLAVDFNVDNLTDRYYLDPLALGVMPAPGRIMRLAVTWRY
ncbi:TonB-dependent receptor [Stenotrophomonas sp. SORGH_AS_0282]|uniref:TonB-dependent receptor domain-containing protein n=1 Tax=Stenotrophomonas sp. SORGH_AS_0282 TaxID=3041763 RepID=UPI00278AE725|nr:TonB-dependent receptor [Stenotrophomonas sp. SORGH_AS_0282]MDQ1061562.1 hemoglobin/transferrin/lactoferrin receptor protein [Stenotrophomonas sp. SORGH_AS_0282]MDQ1190086.1 hemoglobin/transferrin/lactoferrin receptor protein [Stenotrophomonas sp. SORGH_AS_0282]